MIDPAQPSLDEMLEQENTPSRGRTIVSTTTGFAGEMIGVVGKVGRLGIAASIFGLGYAQSKGVFTDADMKDLLAAVQDNAIYLVHLGAGLGSALSATEFGLKGLSLSLSTPPVVEPTDSTYMMQRDLACCHQIKLLTYCTLEVVSRKGNSLFHRNGILQK